MLSSFFFCCLALQTACFVSPNKNYQGDLSKEVMQRLSTLEKEVSFLKEKLESRQGENQISIPTRVRRIVSPEQQSQVAFHAHLSKNLNNLGVHQAIHFDKILLNEGNGYSVHAGEFVASAPGLYVFSWSIASGDPSCMKYELVQNSAVLTYSISDAANPYHKDWAVSSGTAVTRMNSGDRVWIRVSDFVPCSHTLFGVGYGTSSFTGFLLH